MGKMYRVLKAFSFELLTFSFLEVNDILELVNQL